MRFATKFIAAGAAGAFALTACGTTGDTSPAGAATAPSPAAGLSSKAVALRTKLNLLLGEHLILAAKSVDAALGGRAPEFDAYGNLLNTNGTDIGDMIGAAYGDEARTKFNAIWSAHDGFFVDYTKGVAAGNESAKAKAVDNLTNVYIPQFSQLISQATGLPAATVADLTKGHVLTTKDIVDRLGAKDYPGAYAAIRTAYAHMQMIADPLAEAIASGKPDLFPGDAKGKAADLDVALNRLLQEHLYLATMATGSALGGRKPEFMAAGTALNANGTDLGAAIGSLYGAEAQTKFNGIWSAHNGFFVDYTTGVATADRAKMDAAVGNLTGVYIPQFSDFISGATGLPTPAVADLTKQHVLTTKDVVDAQGARDAAGAAQRDRTAAQHMQMIADPLAAAIVSKLPDKFAG